MRLRRIVAIFVVLAALVSIAFSFYLSDLYQQLGASFVKQEEFIPTRIYSDLTRFSSGIPLAKVEARLKSLGYFPEKEPQDKGLVLKFKLHSIDYPVYLLPEDHPVSFADGEVVKLAFEGDSKAPILESITLGGEEIEDLYLEPELVATLTRGAESTSVREYLKFEEIPALVWKAIISIEDQHFLDHRGFDPRGIARAIWVNLKTRSFAQGGSTITQQLVKNLMARRGKDIFRKFNELFLALMLEARFSKEEILERYLNEVYLGQIGSLEVHGVAEGAKHFFGKRVDELNLGETALMAGLIRGPGYYSPYRYKERALERQRLVLKKMVETGQVAEAEAEEAARTPVQFAPPQNTSNKAPYFSDFVKAEMLRLLKDRISEEEISRAGFQVYTTLDLPLNQLAQKAVAQGVADVEKKMKTATKQKLETDRLEGALASVEQDTGMIRALVGGRNYAQSTFNRILNMKRQVGSTFKPVVYLASLLKGRDAAGVPYGPGYPVEDASWTLIYDKGRQTWTPRNYEKEFRGWISSREALAHSINTVTAKLGYEVGISHVIETARALGVDSDLPPFPSLALGVAEMSPVELLRLYATVANHGEQYELSVIRGITQNDGTSFERPIYHPKKAIDPGPADLLTDMLQSIFKEGTARGAKSLGFTRAAAGKTGTTSDYRDSWFAGYTPDLTTVVWVGMDQSSIGEKIENYKPKPGQFALTGATSALPIWVEYMKGALEGTPESSFGISSHLSTILIDSKSGKLALTDCPGSQTALEKYVSGNEPTERACEALWPPSEKVTVEQ